MRSIGDRIGRWPVSESAAAVTALVTGAYVGGGAGLASFPLDDAWIHMVYGLALRREGSLAYNDGIAATGCTSTLWAMIAGLAHVLSGGGATASAASAVTFKALTLLAFAVGAALAARLARVCAPSGPDGTRGGGVVALGAGLAVATCPVLAYAATSGMEVALTSALLLGAMLALATRRTVTAAICVGLAAITRPECALAIPLVLAATELTAAPTGRRLAMRFARLASACGPLTLVLARTWHVSHRLLPATYYAKARPSLGHLVETLRASVGEMLPTSHLALVLLVLAAAVIGVVRRRQRGLALATCALTGLGLVLASAAVVRVNGPLFYFQRYFAPGFPLLVVSAVLALAWLVDAATRPRLRRVCTWIAPLILVAAIAEQLAHLPASRSSFTESATTIDAVQVSVGRYVHEALAPTEVVWSVDAGAVRYWGGRPTVDVMRLNTPDAFDGPSILKTWRASMVVIVPSVFTLEAAPGLLERTRGFERPDDPDPPQESPALQWVLACRPEVTPRRILVRMRDAVIATGRCVD